MKDLSDLHNAAVETGQPEMFKKTIDSIVWRARLRQEQQRHKLSSTSGHLGNVDVDDSSLGTSLEKLGAVRFVDMGEPEPPRYLIRNCVEEAHPTYIYGGRGSLKSISTTALGIAIASPEVSSIFGFAVEEHGPVIIYDSELNANVFNRRATEICNGLGIQPPKDLYYKNAVGTSPSESFPELHRLANLVDAVAVIVDSWGFATRGIPESYDDVRTESAEYLHPLMASGIAPIIVEHKPHQGNHLFGSVAKEYHGRYIFRVDDLDGDDRVKGERNTMLINEKASFTDEGQKITLKTRFEPGRITIENTELEETPDKPDISAPGKVRLALSEGERTKPEIAEFTGYTEEYLANLLPKMVKRDFPGGPIYHVGNKGRQYLYSLTPKTGDELSSTSTLHREPNVDDGSEVHSETVSDPEELDRLVTAIDRADRVALDLETMPPIGWIREVWSLYKVWRKGLKNKPKKERMRAQWDKFKDTAYKRDATNPETAQVRLLSLATDKGLNEAVDVTLVNPAPVLEALKTKTVIAHNSSFDLGVLRERYGCVHEGRILDTQLLYLMHHYAAGGEHSVIRDGKRRLPDPTKTKVMVGDTQVGMTSLVAVLQKYLPNIKLDKSNQAEDWSVPVLSPEMVSYSLLDSSVLLELADVLQNKLDAIGMSDIVDDIESRATSAKVWMERNGIPARKEVAKEMGVRYSEEALRALDRLLEPLESETAPDGRPWSWTIDNHVRAALVKLGANLDELDMTGKTKVSSTSKDSLKKINAPKKAVEWVETFLEWKSLVKRSSDFIDKYAELVRENGTIPGRFDTVSTGRYNCTKPNLQQVPSRGELQTTDGMRIRDIFRAREGESLIVADFEQVELLLAATIAERRSGTKSEMLDVFRAKDSDIHRATAAWVLGKPEEDISKPERTLAKALNFGLVYGCSADKLLEVAVNDYGIRNMKVKDAERYRKAFFEKYPEFVAWHKKVSTECRRGIGYATTPRGRRRKLPKWDKSGDVAFTTAVNHPVQGAGADAIKLTLAKLFEDRHNCPGNPELNCTVHDEVILSVKGEHADAAKAWVAKHMADAEREAVGDPNSPIAVDVEAKGSWGE